jgi:hypothetical protein
VKLCLVHETKAVDLFKLEVEDLTAPPSVYIDDKLVPPALASIILRGLDSAMNEYLDTVELMRRLEDGT